nr:hypothetical protein [Solidesulfovibrio fructosivorans]
MVLPGARHEGGSRGGLVQGAEDIGVGTGVSEDRNATDLPGTVGPQQGGGMRTACRLGLRRIFVYCQKIQTGCNVLGRMQRGDAASAQRVPGTSGKFAGGIVCVTDIAAFGIDE